MEPANESLDVAAFPNLLPKINLTAAAVKQMIAPYSLKFLPERDAQVEWRTRLPMFAHSFYAYILQHQLVPTQMAFWEQYAMSNEAALVACGLSAEQLTAVQARAFRAYPSLVRDVHFSLFVQEQARTAQVIYNVDLDIVHGIDLLIGWRGRCFGVHLFTTTRRAAEARQRKGGRHRPLKNVTSIELPVLFDRHHAWGQFFIYGVSEFNRLWEIVTAEITNEA